MMEETKRKHAFTAAQLYILFFSYFTPLCPAVSLPFICTISLPFPPVIKPFSPLSLFFGPSPNCLILFLPSVGERQALPSPST